MDFSECLSQCKDARLSIARHFAGLPDDFALSCDGRCVTFLSASQGGRKELYFQDLDGDIGWRKLQSAGDHRQFSRSEQLLRERMRVSGTGITRYKHLEDKDTVFVQSGPVCSVLDVRQGLVITQFPELPGSVDHQLCPQSPDLLVCVEDGDLWLCSAARNSTHRLTDTATHRSRTLLTAGQPSFIIQEEFDRYTGFWWQPGDSAGGGTYRILYEEVDESRVGLMRTFDPSSQCVEEYRYPRPGSENALSRLRLLKFSFSPSGQLVSVNLDLHDSLSNLLPNSEYLARVGWTPDGSRLWVMTVDRWQRHLQVATIDLACFRSHDRSHDDAPPPSPIILWEEQSEHWVYATDHLQFLPPTSSHSLRLLLSSSLSGHCHLSVVEVSRDGQLAKRHLTTGQWSVLGSEVWVDEDHGLVMFEANICSPSDRHLYAVQLSSSSPCSDPVQLTESGYFHRVTVFPKSGCFVDVYSNPSHPPSVQVCTLTYSPNLSSQSKMQLYTAQALPSSYSPPHHFSFPCESGELLYGAVYPPTALEQGRKYPTVVYVYGGPQIQLVTNDFSQWLVRIEVWRRSGFAVVAVDNRGSANRGIQFEAYIKGLMGELEVRDQVRGLQQAAQEVDYLDQKRVAIVGWSYGGYMALMGLAREPQVFKVAVAGAPVTDWMAYDTGYTERYLGVPPESAEAYSHSSVLPLVPNLPSEPGRLLVLHGLNDENVFFIHTSQLVQQLVAYGKPYSLQVYIGERHGLRSPTSAMHCEATILGFLLRNL